MYILNVFGRYRNRNGHTNLEEATPSESYSHDATEKSSLVERRLRPVNGAESNRVFINYYVINFLHNKKVQARTLCMKNALLALK